MVKMLSGKIKYIFPDFSFTHRRMCVYTVDATLLKTFFSGRPRNVGKKIFQSSRFNVLADFYITVFDLKFVIIKLTSFWK